MPDEIRIPMPDGFTKDGKPYLTARMANPFSSCSNTILPPLPTECQPFNLGYPVTTLINAIVGWHSGDNLYMGKFPEAKQLVREIIYMRKDKFTFDEWKSLNSIYVYHMEHMPWLTKEGLK